MDVNGESVGLADAIEALHADLASALEKAADHDVQFPIERLTVELRVGVTRSTDGKAGFRVPFVGAELGGSKGINRESLQTVTISLGAPVDSAGNPVKVASASEQLKG